ncbi:MAG: aconitate hydratase AcnA [Burkholderiales bacterium]|nr:aconitate hydratase AcnA [Burkholderiales bacterium]MDE1927144.1 aconitate hydratase AcnA [Burkholderiales bacterium]
MPPTPTPSHHVASFDVEGSRYACVDLRGALAAAGLPAPETFPASLLVLLEGLLRESDGRFDDTAARALQAWLRGEASSLALPWRPARVLLQDYTGIPVLVDLAALREAAQAHGLAPDAFGCHVQTDLVIDHSLSVDHAGHPSAAAANAAVEQSRNAQRFGFLRWAQASFPGLRVFPSGSGICHQINMEFLASVVCTEPGSSPPLARPDSVLGADSHTTTINGLGVLGWGVGGIEALAAVLGRTQALTLPEVVGVRLLNRLPAQAGATDLVLSLTERLRLHGVVGRFVEFCGPGLSTLSAADRATVANMAPESGATCAFFPVDEETLGYLRQTARSAHQVALVETYCRRQGLWRADGEAAATRYSTLVEFDLAQVEPCVAGPSRPEQRLALSRVAEVVRAGLPAATAQALAPAPGLAPRPGDVVLAAITSCTNTANPHSMVAAGLLARNATRLGLRTRPWVKTSFAPGSRVVADYLARAGLQEHLDALGFDIVGFGCTTCIGNAGPLLPEVDAALRAGAIPVAALLSGNRNFAYRVHAQVQSNFLASPALVVAYALAGTTCLDLSREPLAHDAQGRPVFLSQLWPPRDEIDAVVREALRPALFAARYGAPAGPAQAAGAPPQPTPWELAPTYVARPPLLDLAPFAASIRGARILAAYGDGLTTDQISPAAPIQPLSLAGRFLARHGIAEGDLHSFGARRGHWQVMLQGAFSNPSARNELLEPAQAGLTLHQPDALRLSIQEAAARYGREGVPLIIVAGRSYGVGSSRDDAAKSTRYLGVQAVLAQSYERIHRANLLALGVLPLRFEQGQDRNTLGLRATSLVDIDLEPLARDELRVPLYLDGGEHPAATLHACIETPEEMAYWRAGGLLPYLLKQAREQAAHQAAPS